MLTDISSRGLDSGNDLYGMRIGVGIISWVSYALV